MKVISNKHYYAAQWYSDEPEDLGWFYAPNDAAFLVCEHYVISARPYRTKKEAQEFKNNPPELYKNYKLRIVKISIKEEV